MPGGLFLVLEGIEGSGKTTQAGLLARWLETSGRHHLLTREPGGTVIGEEVRRVLLAGGVMDARTELLLMLSARAALVTQVIGPALAAGQVVIADRYELSTLAYQAHGRGLPIPKVRELNDFATGGLRPNLTVVLTVPRSTGEARRAARSVHDRIESAGDRFHERVEEGYRRLVAGEPGVVALDGTGPPPAVHEALLALLRARFPETFGAAQG